MGHGSFNCLKKPSRQPRDFVPLDGARLHGADIPPDIRRRIEHVYAADFESLGFCRF